MEIPRRWHRAGKECAFPRLVFGLGEEGAEWGTLLLPRDCCPHALPCAALRWPRASRPRRPGLGGPALRKRAAFVPPPRRQKTKT